MTDGGFSAGGNGGDGNTGNGFCGNGNLALGSGSQSNGGNGGEHGNGGNGGIAIKQCCRWRRLNVTSRKRARGLRAC